MSEPNSPATPPADAEAARGYVEQVFAHHSELRQQAENAGDTAEVERLDALIGEDVAALTALKDDEGQTAAIAARYQLLLEALGRES